MQFFYFLYFVLRMIRIVAFLDSFDVGESLHENYFHEQFIGHAQEGWDLALESFYHEKFHFEVKEVPKFT